MHYRRWPRYGCMRKERGGATEVLPQGWKDAAKAKLHALDWSHEKLAGKVRAMSKTPSPTAQTVTRALNEQATSSWGRLISQVLSLPPPSEFLDEPPLESETDREWARLKELDPAEYAQLLGRVRGYIAAKEDLRGDRRHAR